MVRRLTRFVDGEPWSVQNSSYPMDIAQECGLMVPHDIPRGTIRAMAEHGYHEVGHHDEVTARMPTPDEISALELGSGVPVPVYVRTAYTTQRPIRPTETVFPSDRNRLVYELVPVEAGGLAVVGHLRAAHAGERRAVD